ncbi:MAG: hypothetical protein ACI38U_12845 [Corynebacterium sp.]|uniref:hypothetical protein n=1 Tax=Corynebacterium sp. TaxID=1720 RepID=UPI003F078BED
MVTAAPNPNLIAFVGDLHGKLAAFEHTTAQALNRGATTIVQVGDFWIYDGPKELPKLQRTLRRICPDGIAVEDIDYRFIDGNHENFDVLNPGAAALVQMSDNVTYMPRGTRAHLAGAAILFFGGASSTDREHRIEGKDWWPAENITTGQAERVTAADPADTSDSSRVDILVTHDTSTTAFTDLCTVSPHARGKQHDPAGETNRAHLDSIVARARPRFHVHGHHHTRHSCTYDLDGHPVTDISLSLEKTRGSVAICDTIDGSWRTPIGRQDTGDDDLITATSRS